MTPAGLERKGFPPAEPDRVLDFPWSVSPEMCILFTGRRMARARLFRDCSQRTCVHSRLRHSADSVLPVTALALTPVRSGARELTVLARWFEFANGRLPRPPYPHDQTFAVPDRDMAVVRAGPGCRGRARTPSGAISINRRPG